MKLFLTILAALLAGAAIVGSVLDRRQADAKERALWTTNLETCVRNSHALLIRASNRDPDAIAELWGQRVKMQEAIDQCRGNAESGALIKAKAAVKYIDEELESLTKSPQPSRRRE